MTRTILVPVDRSPQAFAAVEHAASVHPDADITLLHVIQYSEEMTNPDRGGRRRGEGWYAEAREEAEELFDDAQDVADEYGVELSTAIDDGKPANVIVDHALEHDFDQIIMGSHGRTGATRILLGSVAETVTRRSQVPVTIVK